MKEKEVLNHELVGLQEMIYKLQIQKAEAITNLEHAEDKLDNAYRELDRVRDELSRIDAEEQAELENIKTLATIGDNF